MYEDTYFLDQKKAIEVAKQQNRNELHHLQICYYNGNKLDINLPNLIHLPFDNLIDELAQSIYRIPTKIDLAGLELSPAIKHEIYKNFNIAIQKAKALRKEYDKAYREFLRKFEPNFSDKWRFYLPAHSSTQVMQYVSKSIAQALEDMGYEVFYDLYYGIEDNAILKNLCRFKPHAIIQINHMLYDFISDRVFGFVWLQDPMPFLFDGQKYKIKKRDFIYSLLPIIDEKLQEKGIPFRRQGFCVNKNIYKKYSDIEREKKIVFVGSSYLNMIPYLTNMKKATLELEKIYIEGNILDINLPNKISKKYDIDYNFVKSRLIPYVVRDISLLKLIQIKSNYKVEIYGHGWDIYKELA